VVCAGGFSKHLRRLLLLEYLVLQLVRQTLWVLNARLCSLVHVTLAPSACVIVLVVLACANRNLGDIDVVLALGGFDVGRTNVGCPSTANAEGAVSMVADLSLANDLSIAIPA
jgi:hypothetical protein